MKALRARGPAGAEDHRDGDQLHDVAQATLNYADLDAAATPPSASTTSSAQVGRPAAAQELRDGEAERAVAHHRARAGSRRRAPPSATAVGVHVEGLDDVMVRLVEVLHPGARRRDHGLRHRGPGVSVHRADCANAVVAGRPGPARG